jgi:hypothetical protein
MLHEILVPELNFTVRNDNFFIIIVAVSHGYSPTFAVVHMLIQ